MIVSYQLNQLLRNTHGFHIGLYFTLWWKITTGPILFTSVSRDKIRHSSTSS
jgi:hypothetical protein